MAMPMSYYCHIASALPPPFFLFLLLLTSLNHGRLLVFVRSASSVNSTVPAGTDLNPDGNSVILLSSNELFQLLFKKWQDSGNSYCMCGLSYVKKGDTSVIWSFNNDTAPVLGSRCILRLAADGDLSLRHDDDAVAWSSQTSGRGVVNMTLRDDGNLVLLDSQGSIVWQSFGSFRFLSNLPSGMNFTRNDTLYDRVAVPRASDFSVPGNYAMAFSPRGHLLLLLRTNMFAYHSFSSSSSSSSLTSGSVDAAAISAAGVMVGDALEFYNDTTGGVRLVLPPNNIPAGTSSPNSSFPIRSGYVEDANFLINYWNGLENVPLYNTSIDGCYMPYACGPYSAYKLCTDKPDAGGGIDCSCPEGFAPDGSANNSCSSSDRSYGMKPINVLFHPQLSYIAVQSSVECGRRCSDNVTCRAALFDSSTRYCTMFPVLYTLPKGKNDSQVMLVKIDASSNSGLSRSATAGVTAAAAVLLLAAGVLLCLVVRRRRRRLALERRDEMFLADLPRLPPRFSYRELEAATAGFSKVLGRGGFGSVYEGVLGPMSVRVAVKRLDRGGGGGGGGVGQSMDEFRSEVATIGSVSHVNLVRLRGFCMEGSVRMLVYEFMENGSLDKWLFQMQPPPPADMTTTLDWETRCRIALDTARGLEYLHYGCAEHIVHCDVKPENILLDHGFHAKVADFGLAKLLGADDQSLAMTTLKGTRGYLAPEWLRESSITVKSDVYSYGVVLLELITGRRCLESESTYLPTWAMSVASSMAAAEAKAEQLGLQEMVLDRRLAGKEVGGEALGRMFEVALACVQADPAKRPAMTTVVQILEEDVLGMQKAALVGGISSNNDGSYDEDAATNNNKEAVALLNRAMTRSCGGGGGGTTDSSSTIMSSGAGARYPSDGFGLQPPLPR